MTHEALKTLTDWYWLSELAKVITPAVVGALAIYIAARQWWTASQKIKLDLYDKRFAIYIAFANCLDEVQTKLMTTEAVIDKMDAAYDHALFLLRQPDRTTLRNIITLSRVVHQKRREAIEGEPDVIEEKAQYRAKIIADSKDDLVAARGQLIRAFEKYLSLDHL